MLSDLFKKNYLNYFFLFRILSSYEDLYSDEISQKGLNEDKNSKNFIFSLKVPIEENYQKDVLEEKISSAIYFRLQQCIHKDYALKFCPFVLEKKYTELAVESIYFESHILNVNSILDKIQFSENSIIKEIPPSNKMNYRVITGAISEENLQKEIDNLKKIRNEISKFPISIVALVHENDQQIHQNLEIQDFFENLYQNQGYIIKNYLSENFELFINHIIDSQFEEIFSIIPHLGNQRINFMVVFQLKFTVKNNMSGISLKSKLIWEEIDLKNINPPISKKEILKISVNNFENINLAYSTLIKKIIDSFEQ